MRIKTTLITLATAMTIACNAGGLYIVSGGDFRQSHIKYTLQTTKQGSLLLSFFYENWMKTVLMCN